MVLIHLKKGDRAQFLHEASYQLKVEEVVAQLAAINNQKVRIERLIEAVNGLCQHGPLRPEGVRGLTTPETYEPAYEQLSADERQFLSISLPGSVKKPDSTGYRVGLTPSPEAVNKLQEVVENAKKLVSNDNVDNKKLLTLEELQETLMLFRGAVMIAYPGYHGLPPWDPVWLILEDKMNFASYFPDCEYIEEKKATIWWARKELLSGQTLGAYVGKNEKTKIVAKMMEKGKGAPLAEPPIDKETHTKMLSFYHKKQEEMKKLEEDNEDDYLNSAWANPQNLKHQLLNGGADVRYRAGK